MRGWKLTPSFRTGRSYNVSVPHEGLEADLPLSIERGMNMFRFPMRGWKREFGFTADWFYFVSVPHEGLEEATGGERWSASSLQRFASVKWIPCRLVA